MKKRLIFFKLFLLAIVSIWLYKSVNLEDTMYVLKKTELSLFLLAFLLNNVSAFFLSIKWFRLAAPLKLNSSLLELLKLNYISIFYSSFIPGQATGEVIKGIKLNKKGKNPQKVWVPIIIDKITNVLVIFIIGLIALTYDRSLSDNKLILFIVATVTFVLGMTTIILFSPKAGEFYEFVKNIIISILSKFNIKLDAFNNFSLTYLEEYKQHKFLMPETIFWGFLIKIPHIFTFYFLALSLDLNLDIYQSSWLFAIVSIVVILPISFSGLGVREGAVVAVLAHAGIDKSSALSLSVLIFITGILTALIGGVIELFSGIRVKQKA